MSPDAELVIEPLCGPDPNRWDEDADEDDDGYRLPSFPNRYGWHDFADDPAPGWRMLTSLPSCPNACMRFPMSHALRERIRRGGPVGGGTR